MAKKNDTPPRDPQTESQVKQFCNTLQTINRIYEDYARSVDFSYTTLEILNIITQTNECTQKTICDVTFLPKQTVNNVITSFCKQGLVELVELAADRRNKTIHLTKSGRAYAHRVIPQIRRAEYDAMEILTPEQREELLSSMEIYCEAFRRAMPTWINHKI